MSVRPRVNGRCAHERLAGEPLPLEELVHIGRHNVNNEGIIAKFDFYIDPTRDLVRVDCTNCGLACYSTSKQEPLPPSFARIYHELLERYARKESR
jgi:hypothetical protein